MSEKNNSNDQFSKFFKKDDAEFDIPYNEEDWLKLEKKLNLRDAKIAYRRKVAIIAVAAVLIISFLGYFTYENYVKINQLTQTLDDQITNNDPVPSNDSSGDDLNEDQLQEGQANVPNVPGSSGLDENIQNDLSDRSSLNETDEPSPSVTDDLAEGFDVDDSDPSDVLACKNCMKSEITSRAVTASLIQNISAPELVLTMSQLLPAANLELPQYQFEDENQPSNIASGFSISLKAAPDLSTVDGFSNFQNPGYSIGLDVGYQISEKISVSTGISRSVVRYQGTGEAYNPPGYLTGGVIPNQITGECVLLDIPLTMKLNLLEFSQSRIFATAGVSSYIMLNEKYEFSYENEYQEGLYYSYNSNTGTAHWMSNAGISIGIEIDIHPNWSLSAEPQIKLPLRKIGVYNVRLYSLGSLFSLNFKF